MMISVVLSMMSTPLSAMACRRAWPHHPGDDARAGRQSQFKERSWPVACFMDMEIKAWTKPEALR
jgi:hypothetical protein